MELDSTYWRERAAEMRKIAGQTKDPQSKGTMLGIAHDYDLLACQFEYRERWTMPGVAEEADAVCEVDFDPNRTSTVEVVLSQCPFEIT